MAEQHQHRHRRRYRHPRPVRHKKPRRRHTDYSRHQSRQRRNLETERHHQPHQGTHQSRRPRQSQQHTQSRRHTLAALKAEKQRPHMPDQSRQRSQSHRRIAQTQNTLQTLGQQHGKQTFQRVAQQSQHRRLFPAAPQHIGRPRVSRTVSPRIGHPVILRHNHRKRQRADQISRSHHQKIRHRQSILF